MARIKNYSLDTTITGGDKLVGTDVGSNNATKSYQVETIGQYFSKTGTADGTRLGYQYNYAGTYYWRPLPGDVLMFPSDLSHYVESSSSRETRIVVSGNVVFEQDNK